MENNKLIVEFMGNMTVYHISCKPNDEYRLWKRGNDGKLMSLDQANIYLKDVKNEYPDAVVEMDTTILKFHFSWDWLMPVIEKIESLGMVIKTLSTLIINNKWTKHNKYNIIIHDETVEGLTSPQVRVESDYTNNEPKLEVTYKAVVNFIKWYNENKKVSEIT
jgi:hypothetical protein